MDENNEILSSDSPGSFEYSRRRILVYTETGIPGSVEFGKFIAKIGDTPYFVSRVISTNDLLKTRIKAGEENRMLVTCDSQTKGRGTGRRNWLDRFGCDVLFSVTDKIPLSPKRCVLPLIIGAAIAANLEGLTGLQVKVKWPNDLVVGKRKLGGILIDVVRDKFAVVGVGINTRSRVIDFPDYLRLYATSVLEELPGSVPPDNMIWNAKLDRLPILIAACGAVLRAFDAFATGDLGGLTDEFMKRDATPGSHRHVLNEDGTAVYAECKSVDLETGEMVVRMPSGEIRRISSATDLVTPEGTIDKRS